MRLFFVWYSESDLQVEECLKGITGGAFHAIAEDIRTLAMDGKTGEPKRAINMKATTFLQTLTQHCELVDNSPKVI